MRTKEELETIAEDMLLKMPGDMPPSELGYVLALMMRGHAFALKKNGHVIMVKTRTKAEVIAEIRGIIDAYEKQGLTKLKELPGPVKELLKKDFDLLGLPHDDLG
jgi:hypothetical protein